MQHCLFLGVLKFVGIMTLLFLFKNIEVSFLLTVKAADPVFTAIFSFILMGDFENPVIYTTLIPIVGGVILR